jgi:hypothetical protein
MPIIKVYVNEEQDKAITKFAAADTRSVSNLLKHAISGHMKRSKKRDGNNRIIVFPED